MSQSFQVALLGAKRTLPVLIGIVPFGLICGAFGVNTGMPEWASIFFSVAVFAGASQLVVNQLMVDHAATWVILLTGLVINVRMVMYSASLGTHFKNVHPLRKVFLSYILTDQAYALSVARYNEPGGDVIDKPAYYTGAAVMIWFFFVCATALGAFIGAFIPPEWELGFAIPLTFTAVVVPAVKDRPAGLAAIVAAAVALLTYGLPYNLGLIAGAVCGILAGYFAERRMHRG